MKSLSFLLLLFALSASIIPAKAQAPQYVVTDLGNFGAIGGMFTYSAQANGVNNSGEVTGFYDVGNGSPTHAFFYSNGSMSTISMGDASGINNSGQVVGTNGDAFVYSSSNGNLSHLGTLGGSSSGGHGINNSGQVTGGSYTSGDARFHAFLYSGGSMTDLGTFGGFTSDGKGINNSGQITGLAYTSSGNSHAFLYSVGSMTDLGTLGGPESAGNSINNSGQVAGNSWINGSGTIHAFLYSGGTMQDLGTLGGTYSEAWGINSSGQVTGSSTTAQGAHHAFLYSGNYSGNTLYDINNLVPASAGVSNIDEGELGNHINDVGQIAANATVGSERHAVLLTPRNMGTAFSGGLGDLPGGSFSSNAGAISNGGSVVAGSSVNNSNGTHPSYFWTLNNGMVSLNDNTASADGAANGVSADGHYVTGYGQSSGHDTLYRYDTQTNTKTFLGYLTGYSDRSVGYSISSDGNTIAGYARDTSGHYQPIRWTSSGGIQGLGWLPGSPNQVGVAYAISSDGNTIVGDTTSGNSGASGNEAFRWQGGTMVGLGDLSGGAYISSAHGVNTDGSVIVGIATDGNGQQAVRWVNGGVPQVLGTLNNLANPSVANAVSGNGEIIVGSSGGSTAFVWDAKGAMRSLQSVLATEYGVNFTGWTLTSANAISVNGDAVAGQGIDPLGNSQAWSAQINSRTYRYMSSENYTGFHTSHLGGFGTSVDIKDGTAGGAAGTFRTLTIATRNSLPNLGLVSDIVNVSGTGTDKFVLQLSYDKAAAQALNSENSVHVVWFNTLSNQWVNAVEGNSSGTPHFVLGAYDSNTDNVLGYYGLDMEHSVVWAVLDHSSDFAVAVPEVSSVWIGIGASIALLLEFYRRRKARFVRVRS